jgi:hypothetical protein
MTKPAPSIAQAMAAGLALDARARDAGYRDGEHGLPFNVPAGSDPLAYAAGYSQGRAGRPWVRAGASMAALS